MSPLLTTAVVAALCLAALNLMFTVALAKRVRTLQDGTLRDPSLPKVGQRPLAFEVVTEKGSKLSHATFDQGEALVGLFASGCDVCEGVQAELRRVRPKLPLYSFILTDELDQQTREDVARVLDLGEVAVAMFGDATAKAFAPSSFPTLLRVRDGAIAASGHVLAEVLP